MSKSRTMVVSALVITGAASLWAMRAGGQVVKPDLTPLKDSPEVQQLIEGTFTPDPDEPAAAVKVYIETEKKFKEAMGVGRFGPGDTEALTTVNPEPPLNEAIAAMQNATKLYPTSRTAWMGLGELLWNKYARWHRARDLRDAIDAQTRAVDLMLAKGSDADGRHRLNLADQVMRGLALLKDRTALDAFYQKLGPAEVRDLALFPYTEALAALNDPRADQQYRRMLAGGKPGLPNSILVSYIEYLFAQQRYQEVLRQIGEIPASDIRPPVYTRWSHLVKGAALERLGRLDEARVEYQGYLDEVAKQKQVWPYVFPANEKFRIPGSALQKGIEFSREPYELPEPQSLTLGSWLLGWISPTEAWADHVGTPCAATDWFCKAQYYLFWTIRGEVGCVWDDPSPQWCIGTTGGQRAVAWNVRTRVFYGATFRSCFGSTQVCTNYAAFAGPPGTTVDTVARRYYYVIDSGGYGGLGLGSSIGYRLDAEEAAALVALYGRVPDPIAGACLAGARIGDPCSGSCTADAGYLNSFFAHQSGIEFRSGNARWECPNGCCRELMMPAPFVSLPSGSACGLPCFAQVGDICPKYGWLASGCPSSYPNHYWGPKWGNRFWRFYGQ